MKKLYSLLSILGASSIIGTAAFANPGDTTVVLGHQLQQLSWYENYDSAIIFPSGNTTYNKILMEFTLGKYNCGNGYNPATAGETSQGRSGWCADWDYDLHIILMKPNGDTMSLGEVITPYANTTLSHLPWTWTNTYTYDVTDFYPMLKDTAMLRIFYAGWSGGFTGTVKFKFIEGTPPRDVLAVKNLWGGDGSPLSNEYGGSNSINNLIQAKTVPVPTGTFGAALRTLISGHGNDNTNCSEFCSKWYQLMVNGTNIEQKNIWKPNCGSNQIYPQSGTWIYDRANWCPGEMITPFQQEFPTSALSNPNVEVDLNFQNYTSNTGGASYKVSSTLFFYGDYNFNNDLGIVKIISPTNDANQYRENGICGEPKIEVKNYGKNTITSFKVEFGVAGQTMHSYTHSANIASNQSAEVTLPNLVDFASLAGNTNEQDFIVRVTEVNNTTDDNSLNDSLSSKFIAAPDWVSGNFDIELKTSANISGSLNRATWKITDIATGTVVATRNGNAASTVYNDTVVIPNGCYKLELDCSTIGVGLRNPYHISNANAGYIKVTNRNTSQRINIEKNRDGKTSAYQGNLEGWVGNGWTQYFTVSNATSVTDIPKDMGLIIKPNPANQMVFINVEGLTNYNDATISIYNTLGQKIKELTYSGGNLQINTQEFASGIYTVHFNKDNQKIVEKLVINH